MGTRVTAVLIICMVFVSIIPQTLACGYCSQPNPNPPRTPHPPHKSPPSTKPPIVVLPPVLTPPVTHPPNGGYPPYPPSGGFPGTNPPPSGGSPGANPPPSGGSPGTNPPGSGSGSRGATCPIDALKLGLCVDVLGGLVHVGLGDPVQNTCCPVLQGLLELEAAICLCTTIRLRVLNLNIFIPLALQVLITCGMNPPPGFVCPPL